MPRRFLNGIDASNQRIVAVADPSANQDAATKGYVDNVARGLDWKASVRAASTGNLTLSGTQTVDGVVLAVGDRVLAKDQATGSQNGIYVVAAAGWTRPADADENAEVTAGMATTVAEGTSNGDKTFVLTSNDPITVGTTALAFTQLGGGTPYTAGAGLSLSGNQFAVVAGAGIIADATSTRLDPSVAVRKFAVNVGTGSATSVAVTHNLGTRDVQVAVYDSATFEDVFPDVVRTDVNTVTLTFATAPAANAFRCVVQG